METPIDKIFVTNTTNIIPAGLDSKVEVLSVAKIFAASIDRITAGQSLSSLFEMES
jgi:phosphoribosylpyrophosphate synthetase